MVSSEMLRRVALVRTDVSDELSASFIGVFLIFLVLVFLRSVRRLLVSASVVPSSPILVTLMKEALISFETSVLTRTTLRNIPQDAILQIIVFFRFLSYLGKFKRFYNFKGPKTAFPAFPLTVISPSSRLI
jgi:hypothetical protein